MTAATPHSHQPTLTAMCRDLRLRGPGLPIRTADDRACWDDRPAASLLVARARAAVPEPWPHTPAYELALIHRTGDRNTYESRIWARQERLVAAAVAAATTGEQALLDEVADGVLLFCEQSTWCWPAHDDAHRERGWVLPDVDRPHLDLGAGEVVSLLSHVDHLLGSQLDQRYPGLRSRIRREARVRVLTPYLERDDWGWLGRELPPNNWNPWILGNLLVATLALVPQEETRRQLVGRIAEDLDRFLLSLPADGGIDEGHAYWWNGACRAVEAVELLRWATHGEVDALAAMPQLRQTLRFSDRMQLGGRWYLNVADGQARGRDPLPWQALFAAASHADEPKARAHALANRGDVTEVSPALGMGRVLHHLTDDRWLAAEPEPDPLDRSVWLGSQQLLVVRPQASSTGGLTLAGKGGHNAESHNHNDIGSFVVALDGVPVVVDAGRPTYTAQTFGPDRYQLWMMRSDWHNLPVVAGRLQQDGPQWAAREVELLGEPDAPTGLGLELGGAYPLPEGWGWRRICQLVPDGSVEVTDTWRTDGLEEPHRIHLLLAGEVSQPVPGVLQVRPVEGEGSLQVSTEAGEWTLETRELDDPLLSMVWGDQLVRAVLVLPAEDSGTVRVQFTASEPT